MSKIPKVSLLEENKVFSGGGFNFIKRGFKVGDGPEGVWEYCRSQDPS